MPKKVSIKPVKKKAKYYDVNSDDDVEDFQNSED